MSEQGPTAERVLQLETALRQLVVNLYPYPLGEAAAKQVLDLLPEDFVPVHPSEPSEEKGNE